MAAAQEFIAQDLLKKVNVVTNAPSARDGLRQIVDVIGDDYDGARLIEAKIRDQERWQFMNNAFEQVKNAMSVVPESYQSYIDEMQASLLAVRRAVDDTDSPNIFTLKNLKKCEEMGVDPSNYVIYFNLRECADVNEYKDDRRPDGVTLEEHANNITFYKAMKYFPELRHSPVALVFFYYEDGKLTVSTSQSFDLETRTYKFNMPYGMKHTLANKILDEIGCSYHYLFESLE